MRTQLLISTLVGLFSLATATFPSCMSSSAAQQVASNFQALIDQPFSTSLAKAALTPNFHDYSDSVIELINKGCTTPKTLGTATFTSRAQFISGQSGQAPIPFTILQLWNTCDTVIMRWTSSSPAPHSPEEEVTGIIVLETVPNSQLLSSQPYLINTVYSEFNSGAWLVDLGLWSPNC